MLGLSLPESAVEGIDATTGTVHERPTQTLSERHLDTLRFVPPATLQASVTPEVADASTPDADAADASKAATAALQEAYDHLQAAHREAAQVKDLARLLHAGQHLRVAGVDEPPEMPPPPPSAERAWRKREQLSDAAAALERGASDLRSRLKRQRRVLSQAMALRPNWQLLDLHGVTSANQDVHARLRVHLGRLGGPPLPPGAPADRAVVELRGDANGRLSLRAAAPDAPAGASASAGASFLRIDDGTARERAPLPHWAQAAAAEEEEDDDDDDVDIDGEARAAADAARLHRSLLAAQFSRSSRRLFEVMRAAALAPAVDGPAERIDRSGGGGGAAPLQLETRVLPIGERATVRLLDGRAAADGDGGAVPCAGSLEVGLLEQWRALRAAAVADADADAAAAAPRSSLIAAMRKGSAAALEGVALLGWVEAAVAQDEMERAAKAALEAVESRWGAWSEPLLVVNWTKVKAAGGHHTSEAGIRILCAAKAKPGDGPRHCGRLCTR